MPDRSYGGTGRIEARTTDVRTLHVAQRTGRLKSAGRRAARHHRCEHRFLARDALRFYARQRPFFQFPAAGDFTAELRVAARYEALYDQAGLMVRIDEANWVKAGVERRNKA